MPASKEELSAAMRRIVDALNCMRGPDGEVIYVGPKALHMAWHLARAGCDVDPDRAIIKARGVRPGIGQLPVMADWVPIDTPDRDDLPELPTAVGPLDLDVLDDLTAWHTQTQFEGDFNARK
jgi:hypothetical protein